jgi:HJR/Mrr/RecB family endonuclease
LLFGAHISRTGGLLSNIFFPNDSPILVTWPWQYFWVVFLLVFWVTVFRKARIYKYTRVYHEEKNFLNSEKNVVEKKCEEVRKKTERKREEERKEAELKHEEERRKFRKEQEAKGLLEYDNKWGTPKQVKEWKEIDSGLSDNFARLSPYQFEKFIAELFEKMGYITTVTPGSGDFGVDVIAKKDGQITVIQVKKYAHGTHVTPEDVQRTLGSMWKYKAEKAVVVTTSDFTTRAMDVQNGAPIELWNKKVLHDMVRKYFIENV